MSPSNGEGVFESDDEQLAAIVRRFDAAADEDPEFVLKLAAYARQELYLRPPEGESRVEKEYSRNSSPKMWTIDTPELTEVVTFQHLSDSVLDISQ